MNALFVVYHEENYRKVVVIRETGRNKFEALAIPVGQYWAGCFTQL